MPRDYYLELVQARVAPADRPYEEGVQVKGAHTLPFLVERTWSGPGGSYTEQWSIRRGGREALYRGPARVIQVWSMQAMSKFRDRVDEPIALEPGQYQLVFVVEGRFMGSIDFEITPVDSAAA